MCPLLFVVLRTGCGLSRGSTRTLLLNPALDVALFATGDYECSRGNIVFNNCTRTGVCAITDIDRSDKHLSLIHI